MITTNKELYDFCVFSRRERGKIQDATRFRNELGLRFYGSTDPNELLERCIERRLIKCDAGNIIIKVGSYER